MLLRGLRGRVRPLPPRSRGGQGGSSPSGGSGCGRRPTSSSASSPRTSASPTSPSSRLVAPASTSILMGEGIERNHRPPRRGPRAARRALEPHPRDRRVGRRRPLQPALPRRRARESPARVRSRPAGDVHGGAALSRDPGGDGGAGDRTPVRGGPAWAMSPGVHRALIELCAERGFQRSRSMPYAIAPESIAPTSNPATTPSRTASGRRWRNAPTSSSPG